jgi:hypothetical protein
MIWHHLYTLRAQSIAAGRSHLEISDFRDEFNNLFAGVPKASTLDRIYFSFTIFDRNNEVAQSGHYGAARPLVVGVENIITPYNEVVLQFSNGRDLRYWEIAASLGEPHAFVASYDTSKIDASAGDTLSAQVNQLIQDGENSQELHAALCTLVAEEQLPRYYVAAIMDDKRAQESENTEEDMDESTVDKDLEKGA